MQYTLIEPGPSRYVLDPDTEQIRVTVTEEVLRVTLIEAVVQVGSDGQAGAPQQVPHLTAVAISGGRLVRLTQTGLNYYDAATAGQAFTLLGISLNAAGVGGSVSVALPGTVTHPGWGLTPGATYLAGPNGTLQIAPAGAAFTQIVGQAIDTNTLSFFPQPIIFPL